MASAPPPNTTEDPRAKPPATNPNYPPPSYQQQGYPPAQQLMQQRPYYQGGYPPPPTPIEIIEQPFADPYRPREIIVLEEPGYGGQYRPGREWERQPLQPGNVGNYKRVILSRFFMTSSPFKSKSR